jgi:hypothetical protein
MNTSEMIADLRTQIAKRFKRVEQLLSTAVTSNRGLRLVELEEIDALFAEIQPAIAERKRLEDRWRREVREDEAAGRAIRCDGRYGDAISLTGW